MRKMTAMLLLIFVFIITAGCADSDQYPRYIISDVTLDEKHSFLIDFELKGDN